MNLWLIVVPCGLALLGVAVMLALAALGVDGFHGDNSYRVPAVAQLAGLPAPAPMPQRRPQRPLQVPAERVAGVEAA